jgi:phosphopantetheine--protein transferase-like protein
MKIYGCGIDIEELCRFEKILKNCENNEYQGLIKDVFTGDEIKNNLTVNPIMRFTAGFSGKESVFKSFGVSWINSGINWKDIEVIFNKKDLRIFSIKLYGYAEKLFKKTKCKKIISSLEYNSDYVVFKTILRK